MEIFLIFALLLQATLGSVYGETSWVILEPKRIVYTRRPVAPSPEVIACVRDRGYKIKILESNNPQLGITPDQLEGFFKHLKAFSDLETAKVSRVRIFVTFRTSEVQNPKEKEKKLDVMKYSDEVPLKIYIRGRGEVEERRKLQSVETSTTNTTAAPDITGNPSASGPASSEIPLTENLIKHLVANSFLELTDKPFCYCPGAEVHHQIETYPLP